MIEQWLTLWDALSRDAHLEDAAARALDAAHAHVATTLAASPWASRARLLGATLFLRAHGAYQQIITRHQGDATSALDSATLWRWVEAWGAPLAMDVGLRVVRGLGPEARVEALAPEGASLFEASSMQRLYTRGASHVLVIPLHEASGALLGMVTVEASCQAAMGEPFIWPECARALDALLRLVTPLLISKRPRVSEAMHALQGDPLLPVVGASMAPTITLLRLFAAQDETVLLQGPTGAGKSRMARWCHARSARASRPFEVLDLLAVPEHMQLAHLVGWRRGAFTGADRDHEGAIARASGGVLFIDEIDKLSLDTQSGLLRLLEERRYRVLGHREESQADVRFIVGTNLNLREAVRQGRFREDLYYRVNVLPARLPGLDERRDEIGAWASYMVGRALQRPARLLPQAQRALERASWPGNLRQLDNVTRRCAVLAAADASPAPAEVIIEQVHVERALAMELGALTRVTHADEVGEDESLTALMRACARAFVREASSRSSHGEALDFAVCDMLKALVLCEARGRAETLEQAYQWLGLDSLAQTRNHYRHYKRHQEEATQHAQRARLLALVPELKS